MKRDSCYILGHFFLIGLLQPRGSNFKIIIICPVIISLMLILVWSKKMWGTLWFSSCVRIAKVLGYWKTLHSVRKFNRKANRICVPIEYKTAFSYLVACCFMLIFFCRCWLPLPSANDRWRSSFVCALYSKVHLGKKWIQLKTCRCPVLNVLLSALSTICFNRRYGRLC